MMIAADDPIDRLIDAEYLAASAAAVQYVRLQAARVLAEIGFWNPERRGASLEALAAHLGVVPAAFDAFAWLIAEAHAAGYASRTPEGRYTAEGSPPGEDGVGRAARDLASHARIVGCSRAMLEYVAGRYPSVLRGDRSALSILLKGEGLRQWDRYFSAANGLYDVHNQLAAEGLCRVWPTLAQPPRILELGTGTGGATETLLRALDRLPGGREADLTLSDISPSFLVRAAERFRPAHPRLRTRRLDFGRPLEEQGLLRGSVNVLVATNALHAAPDLVGTLTALRRVVAPEAVLIVSESLCPPGGSIHQEFVFNLLGGVRPSTGRASRFLSSAAWRERLQAAGWTARVQANRNGPELAMLAVASDLPATPL